MIQKGKAPVVAGAQRTIVILSDLESVPDSYFSTPELNRKRHGWVTLLMHRHPWRGSSFNPHGPELDGAGGIVGKPDKRLKPLRLRYHLTWIGGTFQAPSRAKNTHSRMHLAASTEAHENTLKETAGIKPAGRVNVSEPRAAHRDFITMIANTLRIARLSLGLESGA